MARQSISKDVETDRSNHTVYLQYNHPGGPSVVIYRQEAVVVKGEVARAPSRDDNALNVGLQELEEVSVKVKNVKLTGADLLDAWEKIGDALDAKRAKEAGR